MKWLALMLLVGCHHGVDAGAAMSWLETRGSLASTWEPCLRIGTAMHAACSGNPQCGLDATRTFTYWCYAGRYGSSSTHADPLSLSPCFWSRINGHGDRVTSPGQPGYVTVDAWAAQVCDQFKLPMEECRAELRDVVQSCNEDLTGAGP